MATKQWLGSAAHVPQHDTIDVSALAVGATATFTINNKPITYTRVAASDDPSIGLVGAIAASSVAEAREVTATVEGTLVNIRSANGRGIPYTIAGGANATHVNVTVATGPNFANEPANWTDGTLPVAGDDLVFDQGDTDCLYDLDAFAGVAFGSISVTDFIGSIGLPAWNVAGFAEYRPAFFQSDAVNVLVDSATVTRVKLDLGTSAAQVQVVDSPVTEIPGVLLMGGAGASELSVTAGSVGVGYRLTEVATIGTVNLLGGTCECGAGATVGDVVNAGGAMELLVDAASINHSSGTTTIRGSAAVAQLRVAGGTVNYNSTGTLGGNTVVAGQGTLDFGGDLRAKTVTNPIEVFGSRAQLLDPHQVIASLEVDLNEAADLSRLNLGRNIRLTRGTPT